MSELETKCPKYTYAYYYANGSSVKNRVRVAIYLGATKRWHSSLDYEGGE